MTYEDIQKLAQAAGLDWLTGPPGSEQSESMRRHSDQLAKFARAVLEGAQKWEPISDPSQVRRR